MPTHFEGETNAERRRYKRKTMNLKIQFCCIEKDNVSSPQSDLAEDLGAGGLAMRSNQDMVKNQLLMITMHLPAGDDPDQENIAGPADINVLARVAWSKPNSDGGYVIGVEFLDLEPGDRQVLKTFLVDYELDQFDSDLYT